MLLEEKRKQESSRAESLVHAEKYLLQHVSKKAINKPLFDNMHDLDPGKSGSKEIHVSSSNPSRRVSSNAADLSDDTHGTTFDAGYKVSKKTLSAPSNIRVDLHLLSVIKCMIPHPMHVTKPVAKCHPLIPLTEVDLQVNPASQMICMMLLC